VRVCNHKRGAENESVRKIERVLGVCFSDAAFGALTGGRPQHAQIDDRKRHGHRRIYLLDRNTVGHRKRCPEHFVAADNFTEALLESPHVERARETKRIREVVGAVGRFQLMQQP
jgi:hypothetical protein